MTAAGLKPYGLNVAVLPRAGAMHGPALLAEHHALTKHHRWLKSILRDRHQSNSFRDQTTVLRADGLSTTILMAEMYSVCNGVATDRGTDTWPGGPRVAYFGRDFLILDAARWEYRWPMQPYQVRPCPLPLRDCGAARPCTESLAQTPHRAGMLVAMADGSGRGLSPTISWQLSWGLVSSDGGECVGGDG